MKIVVWLLTFIFHLRACLCYYCHSLLEGGQVLEEQCKNLWAEIRVKTLEICNEVVIDTKNQQGIVWRADDKQNSGMDRALVLMSFL